MSAPQQVERLDYSRPPRNYRVDFYQPHPSRPREWGWTLDVADGLDQYSDEIFADETAAIAAAWSHYKERHDPPGLETWNEAEGPSGGVWMVATLGESGYFADYRSLEDARAAAWAWHDRRLALYERLACEDALHLAFGGTVRLGAISGDLWPRCLTWSDDQAASVERWLVDSTAEMPGVLRG